MSKTKTTLEHEIEDTLTLQLAKAGHLCLKFVSPGFPGVPDRLVLTNDGRVILIECKAPGRKPRRTQPKVLKMLRERGHRVEVIDTFHQIDLLMQEFA